MVWWCFILDLRCLIFILTLLRTFFFHFKKDFLGNLVFFDKSEQLLSIAELMLLNVLSIFKMRGSLLPWASSIWNGQLYTSLHKLYSSYLVLLSKFIATVYSWGDLFLAVILLEAYRFVSIMSSINEYKWSKCHCYYYF